MNNYKRLTIVLSVIILLFTSIGNIYAGKGVSDKSKYKSAEEFLTYDEFEEALKIYLELYKENNNNFNFAYKIGYCYLTGEKTQDVDAAIEYFLLASEHIAKRYKNNFKETEAPVTTWYYLGVAYRLNKEFDKAIDAFKRYDEEMRRRERKSVPGKFIQREIQTCKDAKEVIDSERMKIEKIYVQDLEEPNVRCPILCYDANRLVFTNGKYNIFPPDINYNTEYSEGPFDGVYTAERNENGQFSNPKFISEDLGIPYPNIPVTATADGSELYLIVDKYDNGDIYVSHYENGKYQPAEKVKKLCSRKWESHATITADGQRIYFTSLRKGGEGGLDIWYSDRDEEGKWQKPVNAGPVINTPFHEEMPYVIRNGNALYFSSEGHKNLGGFDMFYSSWDESQETWTEPVNLGYPFSTAGNDMGYIIENTPIFAFCPVNDNKRRDGVEECDCISLIDEEAPQLASISGLIELDPENQEKLMGIRVKLIDKDTGDEIADVGIDENGNYKIEGITSGSYDLIAYDETGDLNVRPIEVPQNEVWDITDVNMIIETGDIAVGPGPTEEKNIMIKNVFFDFDKYDIKSESIENLDLIADYLVNNPDAKIKVVGHTDFKGTEGYNVTLSQNRAVTIRDYLVSKGVSNSQLVVEYYGETQPITVEVEDDEIRHFNRRVMFEVMIQGEPKVMVEPIIIPEGYILP
ncbi:MAG: hypothetical protein C0596_14460 [Marinilabiliales bacterium]|nr:MAG: hypothetical protein C0596_14460 [Marinilabiliales bacterium]